MFRPDPKVISTSKKNKVKCSVTSCLKTGVFKNGICDKCTLRLSKQKETRRTVIKKESDALNSTLFRKAKQLFQLLIRMRAADKNGYCIDVHGVRAHYKKLDGGHYIPADRKSTCFVEMNVHPQNRDANFKMNESQVIKDQYKAYLVNRYGQQAVDELIILGNTTRNYSCNELEDMIQAYTTEIEFLKKTKFI